MNRRKLLKTIGASSGAVMGSSEIAAARKDGKYSIEELGRKRKREEYISARRDHVYKEFIGGIELEGYNPEPDDIRGFRVYEGEEELYTGIQARFAASNSEEDLTVTWSERADELDKIPRVHAIKPVSTNFEPHSTSSQEKLDGIEVWTPSDGIRKQTHSFTRPNTAVDDCDNTYPGGGGGGGGDVGCMVTWWECDSIDYSCLAAALGALGLTGITCAGAIVDPTKVTVGLCLANIGVEVVSSWGCWTGDDPVFRDECNKVTKWYYKNCIVEKMCAHTRGECENNWERYCNEGTVMSDY